MWWASFNQLKAPIAQRQTFLEQKGILQLKAIELHLEQQLYLVPQQRAFGLKLQLTPESPVYQPPIRFQICQVSTRAGASFLNYKQQNKTITVTKTIKLFIYICYIHIHRYTHTHSRFYWFSFSRKQGLMHKYLFVYNKYKQT